MDASRVVGSEIDNRIVSSLLINALGLMNLREDTLQIPLMNGPVAEAIALTVKWSFVRKSAPASGTRYRSVYERATYIHSVPTVPELLFCHYSESGIALRGANQMKAIV
jgi:hypothetical protein